MSSCWDRFGFIMWLVVDSMAGSACAAFRAVGPCICSWFVWSYAPVRSTTEERWPQDAEDLSQCLSQGQNLQRKEDEDIRQCLKKYQCTDDCVCIGSSIYCIRPSIHACIQLAKGKQTNRRMHQGLPGLTWIAWIALNCYFFYPFWWMPLWQCEW